MNRLPRQASHARPLLDEEVRHRPMISLTAEEYASITRAAVVAALEDSRCGGEQANREWLSVLQVCETLGRSNRWVLSQLRAEGILGRKVGNAWRVARAEVEYVLANGVRGGR